jgi:nucleotide-binding universal stress UspA family protein
MHHPERKAEEQAEVYERFARDVIRSHEGGSAARRIARVLVPIDFSVSSMWSLRHAEEIARRFGAEIVLVHVDPLLLLGPEVGGTREVAIRKELDGLVSLLQSRGMPARGVLVGGAPIDEIAKVAEAEHADLIVMGTHGRTGLAHVLIGSVAESVLRKAPCPVLTVRHSAEK